VNVPAKFEVLSFIRSCDNIDWSFGSGLQTPNFGKQQAVGVGDGTVRMSVGDFL